MKLTFLERVYYNFCLFFFFQTLYKTQTQELREELDEKIRLQQELEEERRLFYVALTRAEKRATLSYATSRYRWGNLITSEPSRFIEEIESDFLEIANPSRALGIRAGRLYEDFNHIKYN